MRLVLLGLSFLLSVSVFAKDKSSGCGLGQMITKKQSLFGTTTRNVIDYFIPVWLSATTTGTSGCDKHKLAQKFDASSIDYALENYEFLAAEMASGQGEYLAGFARTFGCSDSSVSQFSRTAKENMEKLYVEQGTHSAVWIYNIKKVMKSNPAVVKGCQNISA